MADNERDLRQEVIKQLVILGFGIVTILLYTLGQRYLNDPDAVVTIRGKLGLIPREQRDFQREALAQVMKEISWMEHGYGMEDVRGD
jgi:hypothetical protein